MTLERVPMTTVLGSCLGHVQNSGLVLEPPIHWVPCHDHSVSPEDSPQPKNVGRVPLKLRRSVGIGGSILRSHYL